MHYGDLGQKWNKNLLNNTLVFQAGYEIDKALREAQPKMKQPGVLMIGKQYYIKIENFAINFPASISSLESAIACVIVYFYILDVQYPEPLKFVYIFFEHLFEFEKKSIDSQVVKKFLSHVLPSSADL